MVAVKKLTELPKQKPPLDDILSRARELAQDCKDERGALRVYEQALKLYPDKPRVLSGLAKLLAAADEKKLRDPKRAVQLAREAAKLAEEKDASALDALADALHANGDWDEAARYAKLLAERSPGYREYEKRAKQYEKDAAKHRRE